MAFTTNMTRHKMSGLQPSSPATDSLLVRSLLLLSHVSLIFVVFGLVIFAGSFCVMDKILGVLTCLVSVIVFLFGVWLNFWGRKKMHKRLHLQLAQQDSQSDQMKGSSQTLSSMEATSQSRFTIKKSTKQKISFAVAIAGGGVFAILNFATDGAVPGGARGGFYGAIIGLFLATIVLAFFPDE